jgi:hypothetical protein
MSAALSARPSSPQLWWQLRVPRRRHAGSSILNRLASVAVYPAQQTERPLHTPDSDSDTSSRTVHAPPFSSSLQGPLIHARRLAQTNNGRPRGCGSSRDVDRLPLSRESHPRPPRAGLGGSRDTQGLSEDQSARREAVAPAHTEVVLERHLDHCDSEVVPAVGRRAGVGIDVVGPAGGVVDRLKPNCV